MKLRTSQPEVAPPPCDSLTTFVEEPRVRVRDADAAAAEAFLAATDVVHVNAVGVGGTPMRGFADHRLLVAGRRRDALVRLAATGSTAGRIHGLCGLWELGTLDAAEVRDRGSRLEEEIWWVEGCQIMGAVPARLLFDPAALRHCPESRTPRRGRGGAGAARSTL
ncbi:MAG: hypothetical protein AAGH15_03230 [Myxococcota bacterium]